MTERKVKEIHEKTKTQAKIQFHTAVFYYADDCGWDRAYCHFFFFMDHRTGQNENYQSFSADEGED